MHMYTHTHIYIYISVTVKRCLFYSIKFKKEVIKTFIILLHSFLPQRLDT